MNAISNHSTPDELPSRRSAPKAWHVGTQWLTRHCSERCAVRASTDAVAMPSFMECRRGFCAQQGLAKLGCSGASRQTGTGPAGPVANPA
jgi:hypothetical protein